MVWACAFSSSSSAIIISYSEIGSTVILIVRFHHHYIFSLIKNDLLIYYFVFGFCAGVGQVFLLVHFTFASVVPHGTHRRVENQQKIETSKTIERSEKCLASINQTSVLNACGECTCIDLL